MTETQDRADERPPTDDKSQDNDACHTSRIRDLIETTEALSAIFARENALLRDHQAAAIAPLQAEKSRLAVAYAQAIREIATNRHLVDGVDGQLMETLREMTAQFTAISNDQRNLLTGAAAVREGIVNAVAQAAEAQQSISAYRSGDSGTATIIRSTSFTYGKAGEKGDRGRRMPIAVNENA